MGRRVRRPWLGWGPTSLRFKVPFRLVLWTLVAVTLSRQGEEAVTTGLSLSLGALSWL